MRIKYHVRLSNEERSMLEALIKQKKPRVAQHKKRHAQILLAIDENNSPLTNQQIAKALNISPLAVTSLRKRFVEEGLEVAVNIPVIIQDAIFSNKGLQFSVMRSS